jgi:multiple sugar transport system substrate-binding protein
MVVRPSRLRHWAQPLADGAGPLVSRRAFLQMAGITAVSVALGGCSPLSDRSRPQAEKQVQLVYQDWRTDWFPPMVQEMLEEFHASQPNIRVFFAPDPEDFQTAMLADFEAGTAADVFQGCCTHFPTWAQMGHTLDLRPYAAADLDDATVGDWDPAQFHALFTRGGQQFGLPKYHGALALYYNKDLFDKYAVDYPDGSWNHDDYLEAMKLLTHDQDGDGRVDLWGSMLDLSWDRIQVHVNAWGGHFVDPQDPTRCRMADPEALAAMEWLRARMWDDRVMATPRDVQNMSTRQAFISERVAMVEDGSWALKDILTGAEFRIGVAPMPAGPARRATLSTTDGFGIYARTSHPDAAWELVRFLIGQDYGRAMARANFLQPARASLVEEWVSFVQEEFPRETTDMDIAVFADGHINGYSVTTEIFANMADAKSIVYEAWEEIFTWGRSSAEMMKDVCRLVEEAQNH